MAFEPFQLPWHTRRCIDSHASQAVCHANWPTLASKHFCLDPTEMVQRPACVTCLRMKAPDTRYVMPSGKHWHPSISVSIAQKWSSGQRTTWKILRDLLADASPRNKMFPLPRVAVMAPQPQSKVRPGFVHSSRGGRLSSRHLAELSKNVCKTGREQSCP